MALEFLISGSSDDNWSDTTMMLLLLLLGLGVFFISANIATQEVTQINAVAFFGIAILFSLIALVWKRVAKGTALMDIIGFRNTQWAGLGIFLGIIIYFLVILFRTIFDPSVADAGNILPFGSIIGVQSAKTFELVVYHPLVETIFFVGVVVPTMFLLVRRFEFTRRLAAASPFLVFLLIVSFNAVLFATYHLYAYSYDIIGSANFINLFTQKLITIYALSFIWILSMQLTKSIMPAITMHVMLNWFAWAAILKAAGQTVGVIELLLWVIVPIYVLYGMITVGTYILPKTRRVRI